MLSFWVILALPAAQQWLVAAGPTDDGSSDLVLVFGGADRRRSVELFADAICDREPAGGGRTNDFGVAAIAVGRRRRFAARQRHRLDAARGPRLARDGRGEWRRSVGRARSSAAIEPLEQLWSDFCDQFGVVWGLRVAERINATAAQNGWNVRLTWHGLTQSDGSPLDSPPGAELEQTCARCCAASSRRIGSTAGLRVPICAGTLRVPSAGSDRNFKVAPAASHGTRSVPTTLAGCCRWRRRRASVVQMKQRFQLRKTGGNGGIRRKPQSALLLLNCRVQFFNQLRLLAMELLLDGVLQSVAQFSGCPALQYADLFQIEFDQPQIGAGHFRLDRHVAEQCARLPTPANIHVDARLDFAVGVGRDVQQLDAVFPLLEPSLAMQPGREKKLQRRLARPAGMQVFDANLQFLVRIDELAAVFGPQAVVDFMRVLADFQAVAVAFDRQAVDEFRRLAPFFVVAELPRARCRSPIAARSSKAIARHLSRLGMAPSAMAEPVSRRSTAASSTATARSPSIRSTVARRLHVA